MSGNEGSINAIVDLADWPGWSGLVMHRLNNNIRLGLNTNDFLVQDIICDASGIDNCLQIR